MSLQVNLSFKVMYAALCDECKKKVKEIVKDQIQDAAVKQILEEEDET